MKKITLSILLLMVSTISNLNSSDQSNLNSSDQSNLNSSDQRGNESVDKALSDLQRRVEKVEYAQDGISLGQRAKNSMISAGFSWASSYVLSQLFTRMTEIQRHPQDK